MEEHQKVNQLVESSDEYLRKNRIIELFEDLSTHACFTQPDNLKDFIIDQLKVRQRQGFKTAMFSESEIRNTFDLFDLKKDGYITSEKCRQALLTLASSEYQQQIIQETQSIEDKVEYLRFQRLCELYLGRQYASMPIQGKVGNIGI